MARDFDLAISGPPLTLSMDFIASGLVELIGGLAAAALLAWYAWWAPLLLGGAWLATHWLLRESGIWKDRNTDEVQKVQWHADYAYRLAVDPSAAKELRLLGLADWTVERYRGVRRQLFELRWEATGLRQRSEIWSVLLVTAAIVILFRAMADDALAGVLDASQCLCRIASAPYVWLTDNCSGRIPGR
jgi:ATP-binding cassette subfamily B protein